MKVVTVILLMSCLGFASVATAQNDDGEMHYYCGRYLSNALDFFCEGNLIKRSAPRLPIVQPEWPWILPSAAHSMGFRGKRQVVAECCDKPCSVDELMTYCGN